MHTRHFECIIKKERVTKTETMMLKKKTHNKKNDNTRNSGNYQIIIE